MTAPSRDALTFGWDLPYPSRRQPVLARNVVATSQPLATQAGIEIMRKGGNAVDAAIAAAATLCVVEPSGNGLGSDAFALVWHGGGALGLNGSGRSPAGLDAARHLGTEEVPRYGWDPVTVPGAVGAWVALSERLGRLPFAELLEPAVRYAADGFPVSPGVARLWAIAARVLGGVQGFSDAFTPGGAAPAAGEIWRSPDMARSLELIASTRGEALYGGELADSIVRAAAEGGGTMSHEDLASYRPEWVEPLVARVFGFDILELPPNGQGIAALQAARLAEAAGVTAAELDSADWVHLQAEAMKLAFADAHAHVADPASMLIDPAALLDDEYLARRAGLVDPRRAGDPGHGEPRPGGTVYLCTGDADGTMVSFIQSNYRGFGSGVVVPGTGISLNDRGNCFSTVRGHPNVVAGGKRPFNTIIPGFLASGGAPLAAFGVMGGPMQPQGHLQVALRMAHSQNPQAACDAPRWQVTGGKGLLLERGFGPDVVAELERRGHDVRVAEPEEAMVFGGAQVVAVLPEAGYVAASDPRKDGQAAGF